MLSLDDRIERLNRQRPRLIGMLRAVWKRGPQAKPFDEDATWKKIEKIIYLYDASERTREQSRQVPGKQRAKKYRELARVLRGARNVIDGAVSKPELSGPIYLSAVDAQNALVHLVAECEKAATQSLMQASRRGRPKGTAALRDGTIVALARCFEEATGLRPTAARDPIVDGEIMGDFAYFVRAFLKADGRKTIEDTSMVEEIKKVLRHARQSAQQSTARLQQ